MNVSLQLVKNRTTANAADLAADYKFRRMEKFLAWDNFVIDRQLKPEMDAKEFYALFDSVTPALYASFADANIEPTHFDNLLKIDCQITERADGVFMIVWADGNSGSNPPCYPPESDRYLPISKGIEA